MKDRKNFKDIQEIRNYIDEIDYQILRLFSDRNHCVEEIVNFKTDKSGIIAYERQKEVLVLRREWAENFNLDPDLFEKIFKMIIKSNIQKELRIFQQRECKNPELNKTS